ncbi:MAG: primosomal protein N' [Bacteroidales bacterium]|nr:primosomal protein N' [Bacteroidales bacterium]
MIPNSFVEVVLPLPLGGTFTYSLPEAMAQQVSMGSRVIVPFGKRKFYTGIVTGFAPVAPREYQVKEVLHVLDRLPIVRHPQLKFWEWLADYYLCSIGDVYKAAIPSGLKIESETQMEVNPDFDAEDLGSLTEREVMVYQLLSTKGKLSAKDIEKETGFKSIPVLMQKMVEKGAAIISETLVEKFRAKKEKCVRVAFKRGDDEAMQAAFAAVKGAPKQEKLLMTLLQLSQFNNRNKLVTEVPQTLLLERSGVTSTILKAMVDKGLIERYTREISRFGMAEVECAALPQLSEAQQQALSDVHQAFRDKGIVLLHGVTSSGKTEVYAHAIDHVLRQGNQVLYLVPEIALTTQLTARLKEFFGNRLVVYHSKFSDNERVEIWNRLLHSNEPLVVVGARSAVFLPFAKLGLVVVDEEHDQSYKQFDPAPRYNARDSAIMLAHMHGAKTLLGSATPAIETYYKATTGKYGLVTLTERFQGAQIPRIEVIDLGKEWKKRVMRGSFSPRMIEAVGNAMTEGKQAIIFHNRRGFAPHALCRQCQYIPKCKYCDVSLTYHKASQSLVCHYCGTHYSYPETCPVCQSATIDVVGYGTERIEDEVEEIFQNRKVLRMDLDSTRNKSSYSDIIEQFSEHKSDILVGTQMVTKGLDFGNVSVVGVMNADALINYPDFRSNERAFNMLEQVSGRAGRREETGLVLVQTREPEHPIIKFVENHDYQGYYQHELAERQAYGYPPFTRLVYINLKHRNERELDNLALIYSTRLRELFGNRVYGPTKPPVARVQSMYLRQIMLKFELNASMKKIKDILRELQGSLNASNPAMRSMMLNYDVDPY